MEKNKSGLILDVLIWVLGSCIYSVAVAVLLEPNQISPGGFTGIATLIFEITGIPTGTVLLLLNIPLLIIQYKKLGSGSIVKTAAATFILSITLNIAEELPPYQVDGVLAAVFGGIAAGFGLSMVLARGATTGGVDVIAKLVNLKHAHLSVGRIILIFDFAVVVSSAIIYGNIESALYSLIAIYASSNIIDRVLYGADKGKIFFIVTDKPKEVSSAVFGSIGRGMTAINAKGVYTDNDKTVFLCAVRIMEAAKLLKTVKSADENAFIIIGDVGEIVGQGFKIN